MSNLISNHAFHLACTAGCRELATALFSSTATTWHFDKFVLSWPTQSFETGKVVRLAVLERFEAMAP